MVGVSAVIVGPVDRPSVLAARLLRALTALVAVLILVSTPLTGTPDQARAASPAAATGASPAAATGAAAASATPDEDRATVPAVSAPASPAPGATAPPRVHLTVEPMLDGAARPGAWAAIRVLVENDGPVVDGELRISTLEKRGSTYGAMVQLPTGARQEHVLYVRVPVFGRFRVQLTEQGVVIASVDSVVRPLNDGALGIAIIAERPERFVEDVRTAFAARGGPPVDVSTVTPEDLPPRIQAWAAMDLLIWQDVPAVTLTTEQQAALRSWVAEGGTLVLLGGSMGPSAFSGLPEELLPYRPARTVDVPAVGLAELLGGAPAGVASLPALAGPLDEGVALGRVGDDAIAARRAVGRGSATILGIDPGNPALAGSSAPSALWARALAPGIRAGIADPDANERSLGSALATLPTVAVPRQDHLLVLLAVYLLLLGPISYLVLRRLDRLSWAWVTMPALIGVFAIAAFVLGVVLKGSSVVVRQLAVVPGAAGVEQALADVQVSVFSPNRAAFDVRLPDGALISVPAARRGKGAGPQPDILVSPSQVRGLRVDSGATRSFRAETTLPVPRVITDLELVDGMVRGTVTNVSDVPLQRVVVLHGGGVGDLGDMAPSETRLVDLAAAGIAPDRRGLIRRLFEKRRTGDAAARLTRATRVALLRHAMSRPGWRDASAEAGAGGRALVLAWRQGATLEVDLGVPTRLVGDTLYLLAAPLRVSGPVTFTGATMRPAIVGATAVTGEVRSTGLRMSRGTLTVVMRPLGFDGTLAVTDLALRLGVTRAVAGSDVVDLVALPDDQQPDPDDPVGTGPPPDVAGGTLAELPSVQLFDRMAGRWIEFQAMDRAVTYRVPAPERFVDPSGAFGVRFVLRVDDGAVPFALESRLEGIAS